MRLLNRNIVIIVFLIVCFCSISRISIKLVLSYFTIKNFKQTFGDINPFFKKQQIWQKTCGTETKPHSSILYLKVQKTGSTTLRSTLLVYGKRYNLSICFDATNLWGLNWPYAVDELKLTKLHNKKCDLIAEEFIFDPVKVRRLMEKDAFFMASVRHPVEHFLSLFKYSKIQAAVERLTMKRLDKWDSMRLFFKHYHLVLNIYATYNENEVRDKYQIDFILPNRQTRSLGIIEGTKLEIIERVESFHFVVVADKYDESMVILREKLCCTVQDVLYRRQNVGRTNEENKEQVPPDVVKSILEFNSADLTFYNVARYRLLEEIKKHSYFEQALGIFKNELELYESKCNTQSLVQSFKYSVCPPISAMHTGHFVENIRIEQKRKLLSELRVKYETACNNTLHIE
ncbi:galactose-3-O-sulfotransferase 2-like [Hydra vulgaris]|uniref:Galactose-3-O-sulfotransferase 2-like n=1 Tax=Hydra vulgaris TaxID=6087 RepID=A0ABM4CSI6_HYDVU